MIDKANIKWLIVFCFKVFDAYAQFEESMISAKMETTAEMGATEEGADFNILYSHNSVPRVLSGSKLL